MIQQTIADEGSYSFCALDQASQSNERLLLNTKKFDEFRESQFRYKKDKNEAATQSLEVTIRAHPKANKE